LGGLAQYRTIPKPLPEGETAKGAPEEEFVETPYYEQVIGEEAGIKAYAVKKPEKIITKKKVGRKKKQP